MIKTVLFTVVTLAGLTVSAPAQIRVQARLGGAANVSVDLGRRYAPPPRAVQQRFAPAPRYTTVRRRVWVPGYQQVMRVPATLGWTINRWGLRVWGVVRPAYTRTVWHPGRWEYRSQRVRVQRRY